MKRCLKDPSIMCDEVESFPGYMVGEDGCVCNYESGRSLAIMRNKEGVHNVGMSRDNKQYKRSITVLVANTFLERHKYEAFDTPINLDGDRSNNHVDNLMWRPRWFAVKYHQQFHDDVTPGYNGPMIETQSGERFENSWEAAIKYGLLDQEIITATMNRTYVWPTYQTFQVLEE